MHTNTTTDGWRRLRQALACLLAACLLTYTTPLTGLAAVTEDSWTDEGNYTLAWYRGHEQDTAYTLSTAQELAGLAVLVNGWTENFAGKTVTLAADLDLGQFAWTPVGNTSFAFGGTLEGGGHTIRNLRITRAQVNAADNLNLGLFAVLGYFDGFNDPSAATVRGLTLADAAVTGHAHIGGVAGEMAFGSRLEDVHVSGTITGGASHVGGLAGSVNDGAITGCSNAAAVAGGANTGGIVGQATDSHLLNCRNTGAVTARTGSAAAGGLVGFLTDNSAGSRLVNSYNTGAVQGGTSVGGAAGSLAGTVRVENVYSSGTVTATAVYGSLFGVATYGSMTVERAYGLASACPFLVGQNSAGVSLDSVKVFKADDGGTLYSPIGGATSLTAVLNQGLQKGYASWKKGEPFPIFGEPAYAVTVNGGIAHGTLSAPAAAAAGMTVTVRPLPAEGYALRPESLVYDDGTGAKAATKNADGSYRFVMPAHDVTLSALFDYAVSYSLTHMTADGPDSIIAGAILNTAILADEGYKAPAFEDVTVTMGGRVLTRNREYVCQPVKGGIGISVSAVTGPVVITAAGVELHHDAELASLVYAYRHADGRYGDDIPVPGFRADKLTYTIELPFDRTSDFVYVTAAKADALARITGDDRYLSEGGLTLDDEGKGTITVEVTAEDGRTVNTYTVAFTTAPSYTASFDLNYSGAAGAPEPQQVATGALLNEPAAPQRTGYTFGGWYREAACTNPWEFAADTLDQPGGVTLYAQWTPITYSIVYELDGGTNFAAAPAGYTIESAAIVLGTPVKPGYTFAGWYTDAGYEHETTGIAAGSTGARTFYAQWTENKVTAGDFTVTPAPNGGGWYRTDVTVRPAGDWTQIWDGAAWTDRLVFSTESDDGAVIFRLRKDDGSETTAYTLSGLKLDKTAPTGTVKIGESQWTAFLHTITFGLFCKGSVEVTVAGADALSGVKAIEVYRSSAALSQEELDAVTDWTAYQSPVTETATDKAAFLYYVRLTDAADNVTYLSSDGVVFDTAAPVITGVENGHTYCAPVEAAVADDHLGTVTLNGREILPADGKLTIPAASGEQTLAVTDLAGNTASVTVTVNEGHTWGAWTVTKQPTAEQAGERRRVCTVDGTAETQPLPQLIITVATDGQIKADAQGLADAVDTRADVSDGSRVEIRLEVKDITASVPAAEKQALAAALGKRESIGAFLDLALFKIVTAPDGGSDRTAITSADRAVTVTVTLPPALWGRAPYAILRLHDGTVSRLAAVYDEQAHTLTFTTDRFSTYAVAAAEQAAGPDTGDAAALPAWFLCAAAAAGLAVTERKRRGRRPGSR